WITDAIAQQRMVCVARTLNVLPEIGALKSVDVLRVANIGTVQRPIVTLEDWTILDQAHHGLASGAARIRRCRWITCSVKSSGSVVKREEERNKNRRNRGVAGAAMEGTRARHIAAIRNPI